MILLPGGGRFALREGSHAAGNGLPGGDTVAVASQRERADAFGDVVRRSDPMGLEDMDRTGPKFLVADRAHGCDLPVRSLNGSGGCPSSDPT